MNWGRLVIAGFAASILFLVLDAALGMLGGWIGAQFFGLSAAQPKGFESKMVAGLVFELINGFMLAAIYALVYRCLPGAGWIKGLSYGLAVWGLRVVMWAFSTFMMTDLSPVTISITVGTGLVEMLIISVATALIYR